MGVNILENLYSGILKIIRYAVIVLACILVITVFVNVVFRYFFHLPLAWSDEAARFLLIWLTFLGAVLANARNEHMQLDLLVKKMPVKIGQVVRIIAYLVIMYILYILINGGFIVVLENLNWKSSALEIPYGYIYSVVPFCIGILMFQTVARIVLTAKALLGINQLKEGGTQK
jgi:TRAP-type transport system small permease protein